MVDVSIIVALLAGDIDVAYPPYTVTMTVGGIRQGLLPADMVAKLDLYRTLVREEASRLRSQAAGADAEWQIQTLLWRQETQGELRKALDAAVGAAAADRMAAQVRCDYPECALFDREAERLRLSHEQRTAMTEVLTRARQSGGAVPRGAADTGAALTALLTLAQKRQLEELAHVAERKPTAPQSPLMRNGRAIEKMTAVQLVRTRLDLAPEQNRALTRIVDDWRRAVSAEHAKFLRDETYFDLPALATRLARADRTFVEDSARTLNDAQKRRVRELHFQVFGPEAAFNDPREMAYFGVTEAQARNMRAAVRAKYPPASDRTVHPMALISRWDDERLKALTPEQSAKFRARSGAPELDARLLVIRWQMTMLDRPAAWDEPEPTIQEPPARRSK